MTLRLLLGRSVSALATALIPTTLTLAVLRATGSAEALGIVLACEMLPMLVLLPIGGVLADRFRPERVVLITDLVRGLTQAAIGVELLLGTASVAWLAILSGLAGAAIAFGSPAVPRLVVAVVEGPDRLRINSRIGVATSLSSVLAPAVSGGVVLVAGPGWAALLTALLFACSAATLGGIRTARLEHTQAQRSFRNDLVEGWREMRLRPWFLSSVLGHGVWHFMAGLFLTIGPVLAVTRLGGESSWVLIVQSGTIGLVVGVFLTPRLPFLRNLTERRPARAATQEDQAIPATVSGAGGNDADTCRAGARTPADGGRGDDQRDAGERAEHLGREDVAEARGRKKTGTPGAGGDVRRTIGVVQVCAALYVLPMLALAANLPAYGIAIAYATAMFGLGLLSPLWETVVANEIPENAIGRVRSFDQLISFAARPLGLAVAAPLVAAAGMTATFVVGGVLVAAANLAAVVRTPGGRPPAAPRR